MEIIEYKGNYYPAFQADGFAARWAFPFANEIIKEGIGYDIGCNRLEWKLPSKEKRTVIPVDPEINNGFDAFALPDKKVDFIFSSHCLEHLSDWVGALDYWESKLNENGILFLYLPHQSQEYWQPQNNRKHIHSFTQKMFENYFNDRSNDWEHVFIAGIDLNNSFYVVATKKADVRP